MTRPPDVAAPVAGDLAAVFDHLCEGYRALGEAGPTAAAHAAERVRAILTAAQAMALASDRATHHDDIWPGARRIEIDRAVYWFLAEPGQDRPRLVAVLFGGPADVRRMLIRALAEG